MAVGAGGEGTAKAVTLVISRLDLSVDGRAAGRFHVPQCAKISLTTRDTGCFLLRFIRDGIRVLEVCVYVGGVKNKADVFVLAQQLVARRCSQSCACMFIFACIFQLRRTLRNCFVF